MTQPDLFTQRSRRTPMAANVGTLVSLLSSGSKTAQQIRAVLGWSKRKVRDVASASECKILSSPGSDGYQLSSHAKLSDLQHARASFRSQEAKMNRRVVEIDRIIHGRTV